MITIVTSIEQVDIQGDLVVLQMVESVQSDDYQTQIVTRGLIVRMSHTAAKDLLAMLIMKVTPD